MTRPHDDVFTASAAKDSAVAVIGLSCRLPDAPDQATFWQNLLAGRRSIREMDSARWDPAQLYDANIESPGKSISKWCGLLDGVDKFDHAFFNISPSEAIHLDPQQRLLLEETWHCMEDAAVAPGVLREARTGVYLGAMLHEYQFRSLRAGDQLSGYSATGASPSITSNRLSYVFGFRGPSQTIDTACCAGLVALHQARAALQRGECEYAFALAVNLNLEPWKYITYSKARMLSPDGSCKTFDARANGYVPGDGVVVVLLARVDAALQRGHRIYGVVTGSAVNHNGHGPSLTAPNIEAQYDVIRSAWRDAGVRAEQLSYIEAHGTGTSLGDPMEVEALTRAFRADTDVIAACALGSLKTNIGHLEPCAGLASLAKVLLMLQHRTIVPSVNCEIDNPIIDFAASPLFVAKHVAPWNAPAGDRLRAGISSFGFGGSNAHVVVEEFVDPRPSLPIRTEAQPFVLSAKTPEALTALVVEWQQFVRQPAFASLALSDVSATLTHGREALAVRVGGLVRDHDELRALLDRMASAQLTKAKPPRIALWLEASADRQPSAQLAQLIERGRSFLAARLQPSLIGGTGVGALAALVLAEVVSFAQAQALAADEPLPGLALRRPTIPFYDAGTQRVLPPFALSAAELERLAAALCISDGELDERARAAALLLDNQFTYRKFIAEWQRLLGTRLDFTGQTRELCRGVPLQGSARVLWFVVHEAALRRTQQRWGIALKKVASPALERLLQLHSAGVFSAAEVVELVNEGTGYAEPLARAVAARQARGELAPSSTLRGLCEGRLVEVADATAFSRALLKAQPVELPGDIDLVLRVGAEGAHCARAAGGTLGCAANLHDSDREPRAALELWLAGAELDLHQLLGTPPHRALALPTYRFQRKRFWLALPGDAKSEPQQPAEVVVPHAPRVQSWNALRDPLLRDHVIDGCAIVPAAASLELMLRVAEVRPSQPIALENVELLAPGFAAPSIELEAAAKDERILQVTALARPLARATRASATQVVSEQRCASTRTGSELAVGQLYAELARIGYGYGPSLRVVQRAWAASDSVIGELSEESPQGAGSPYLASPHLVDGALQLLLMAALSSPTGGAWLEADALWIPQRIAQVQLFAPLSGRCTVVVRVLPGESAAGDLAGDLSLFDADGELAMVLRGALLKRVPRGFLARGSRASLAVAAPKRDPATATAASSELSAQPPRTWALSWVRDDAESEPFRPAPRTWVVRDRGGFSDLLASALEHDATRLVQLDECDVDRLAPLLDGASTSEPAHVDVWYAAGLSATREDEALLALSAWLKALINLGSKVRVRFLALSSDTVAASPRDQVHGFQSGGLAACGRVAALESTRLSFGSIDLTDALPRDRALARRLPSEAARALRHGAIALREAAYVAVLARPRLPATRWQPARSGPYLITGGAGGLGQQLAKRICTAGGTVALIGRSAPGAATDAALAELAAAGGTAHYYAADVADRASMTAVLERLRSELGPVRGVFHCSGVLRDGLLLGKRPDAVEAVLRPKLRGALVLDALTERDPLEFFVLFSSIVALTGNRGQADYAAANGALDAFAHARARRGGRGRTLSINWGLWAAPGMASPTAVKQLAMLGIAPMAAEPSFAALEQLLASDLVQAAVVAGEPVGMCCSDEVAGEIDDPTGAAAGVPGSKSRWIAIVRDTLAELLSIDASELDPESDLADYGVDSLAITTLVERLEVHAGESLPHALVLEHGTIARLAQHLSERYGSAASEAASHALLGGAEQAAARANAQDGESATASVGSARALVRNALALVLQVSANEFDDDTELSDYGLDSLGITNVIAALEPHYGGTLDHSLLLDYPTIRAVSEKLAQLAPPAAERASSPSVAVPVVSSSTVRYAAEPGASDIAVIGLACRLPGAATLSAFWEHLQAGRDLVGEVPEARFRLGDVLGKKGEPGKSYSRWGAFVDGIELFDPEFFRFDGEASLADPQQRIVLELLQALLEDAGYRCEELAATDTALVLGASESSYEGRRLGSAKYRGAHGVANVISNMIGGRAAQYLDLRGPVETVYTACSSSLVAIHSACQHLLQGTSRMAIAGGVQLLLDAEYYVGFSQAQVLSPVGRCKVFDSAADGFVLGEGAGAVLLKSLRHALEDGDRIRAVIKGSAVNNDGRTMGLTTPSGRAQTAVIQSALRRAHVLPEQIGYYEAHGTGTVLGDPIEIKAASEAFRAQTDGRQYCAVGSVKSNIGHLLSAAGVASFLKTALSIEHGKIVPTLHCANPHPRFGFEQTPFRPARSLELWARPPAERVAGVSSFGFGGTNCHLVMAGFDPSLFGHRAARSALAPATYRRRRCWVEPSELGASQANQREQVAAHAPMRSPAHVAEEELLALLGQLSRGKTDRAVVLEHLARSSRSA